MARSRLYLSCIYFKCTCTTPDLWIRRNRYTTMADESRRLLTARNTPDRYRSDSQSPRRTKLRPPFYTLPSSQSLRSYKSSTDLLDSLHKLKNTNNQDMYDENIDKLNKLIKPSSSDFSLYAYISYYIPILKWLPQYNISQNITGDILASLCMTSFQIPLVMSFAKSLAHLPPVAGLYSIIISSIIYPILGTVPILIVGPAPSSAIIFGQTIDSIENYSVAEISSAISAGIGGILLALGFSRFGFLDNILSRALLKGFLAAMGIIMVINQLSVQLGINLTAPSEPHSTTWEKVTYLIRHVKDLHKLTALISLLTLVFVLVIRKLKSYLISKYDLKKLVYLPDLLLMVVIGTFCCYHFEWYLKGVEIVGDMSVSDSIEYINPFVFKKLGLYKKTFEAGFLCTILGLIDLTTATKTLDAKFNFNISSNRELVALGSINFVISIFSGLPSFGALGRSKINIMAGASSPMVMIFMAIFTVITTAYLLPYLHYLPDCILGLTTTIIGLTVLEEIPQDLRFFWDVRGYPELVTFVVVFFTTILWSAQAGVYVGVLISVVRIIKLSSRSNIQILGRVPHTNAFRNVDTLIEESFINLDDADALPDLFAEIQEIEGVLIIKISEPLNFANIGDLKNKLSRIEKYGTLSMHPSQPINREFNTIKCVIFDCKGMNRIDAPGVQVLHEIVERYLEDGINVWFSRVPLDEQVRNRLRNSGIVDMVNEYTMTGSLVRSVRSFTVLKSSLGEGFFLSIEDALSADSRRLVDP